MRKTDFHRRTLICAAFFRKGGLWMGVWFLCGALDGRAGELSGVRICGAVDANQILVDFASDRPVVEAHGATVQVNPGMKIVFDREGGFASVHAPREEGWDLNDFIAVAVDVRNSGESPVTVLGKLNHNVTSATLVQLNPGDAEVMVLYLFRKNAEKTFSGMRGAPGGDIHFWGGYDPVVIHTVQVCDLDGKAVGGAVTLERIRAVGAHLKLDPEGDAFYPFVDKFGQYKHENWLNKVSSVEELHERKRMEDLQIAADPRSKEWSRYGGWAAGPEREATGHFRTEKIDGKWWFVDPEGFLFWSIGSNGVHFGGASRIEGREHYFQPFPEGVLKKGSFHFGEQNLKWKYGKNWREESIQRSHDRLSHWRQNTCGNWSSREVTSVQRTPYVVAIHLAGNRGDDAVAIRGDETRLREVVQQKLARHAASAEDPWCIGYFIDNELNWNFMPDIDMYYRVVHEEIRKAAPHKLYLGSRIHNRNEEALAASAKYCDVISINCYEHSPIETPLDAPYLIGEFHFGSLDRGMLATGLRSAGNQRQRANSYKHYMGEAIERSNIVGAHWFTFREQALTGRGDGENYQVGFLDITDTPYAQMVEASREIGETIYAQRWSSISTEE